MGNLQQFTLENRRSRQFCRNLQQAPKTSHACTASTVLEPAEARNKKRGPSCAEAVEDEDSLWKALEKTGKFSAMDYADEPNAEI